MYAFSPTGIPIQGTLEKLTGRSDVVSDMFDKNDNGQVVFKFQGATTIFWDGVMTARNEQGEVIFLDEDGEEWPASALVLTDNPAWQPGG